MLNEAHALSAIRRALHVTNLAVRLKSLAKHGDAAHCY